MLRLRFMNTTGSYSSGVAVSDLDDQSRGTFVSRTYGHLFGAVMAFLLIEVVLFKTGAAETIAHAFLSVNWLLVLGGFVVASWIARYAAHNDTSKVAHFGV